MVAAGTWSCGMVGWKSNCYGGFLPVSRLLSCLTRPFKLHSLTKGGGGKRNSSSSRYHKMSSMQVLEKPSSLSDTAAPDYLPLSSSSASSSYETAMDALSSLITRQRRGDKSSVAVPPPKYGKLDRMRFYLQILDLEERIAGLKIIHVAGTKGKGSTCTFCEAILRECGFRTGLFTSPHLIDVRERFRIDGLDISEDKFLVYFWECWNRLKEHVTDDLPMPPLFQFLTVLAFKIFVSEQVDVSIIEVGLGGGNDSTNVIKEPIVCGITSLGMDHTETLGNTLREIASHKAGIFKPQVPAFAVPQNSEAMHVLWEKANELEVPLSIAEPLDVNRHQGLKLRLLGDHQLTNAGLALSLCKSWLRRTGNWDKIYGNEVNQETSLPKPFLRGLSTAHLSGRAQIVYDISSKLHLSAAAAEQSSGDLIFYLDGAHSPESMEACAKWFSSAVQANKQSAESNLPFPHDVGSIPEIGRNGCIIQPASVNYEQPDKIVKKILLFNCMEVRDPEVLLPCLVDTCAFSGIYFSKAIFVPSISTYRKVTSGSSAIPMDFLGKDLSWQLNLQKIWERIIHGKDVDAALNKNSKAYSLETLPPREFLYEDVSNCSAIIPSLPLAIKWLRACVRENPTLHVQVLVTGSLHLVGDVLKILRR